MQRKNMLFRDPADRTVKLWRYMDFTKFVFLLQKRQLFFARADELGDSFEGSVPHANIKKREQPPANFPPIALQRRREILHGLYGGWHKDWLSRVLVNCWHMNNHESIAMWQLYAKGDAGIAIQTSFVDLQSAFDEFPDDVYVGTVRYIDYETEYVPDNDPLGPFIHKRKSFEHECEVRAVIARPFLGRDSRPQEPYRQGIGVEVDLERLIHRIYISPSAPRWFTALVRDVVVKYGQTMEVHQSGLNQSPVY